MPERVAQTHFSTSLASTACRNSLARARCCGVMCSSGLAVSSYTLASTCVMWMIRSLHGRRAGGMSRPMALLVHHEPPCPGHAYL